MQYTISIHFRPFVQDQYTTTTTTTISWLSEFCPGLPGWAGTWKVKPKPIWISSNKRYWVAVALAGQAGLYANSAPRPRQITTPASQHLYYNYYYYNLFKALRTLSGTTGMSRYQKKHSPPTPIMVINHPLSASSIFLRSMASSLINLHAYQSFSTISLHVFFGLPLGLAPSTSYSIHFFTQSLSSFCSTCLNCNIIDNDYWPLWSHFNWG